jgi:hypothetical protein
VIFSWASYQAIKENTWYALAIMKNGFITILMFSLLFLVFSGYSTVQNTINLAPIPVNNTNVTN